MINREALFSDETETYRTPYEPLPGDTVTVTVRTLRGDVTRACCVVEGDEREMRYVRTDGTFDYFDISFPVGEESVGYHFALYDENDRVLYDKIGCVENAQPEYAFRIFPGFTVPSWARGAVYYQIFTDRFRNGTEDNDVRDNEYYYTGGHSRRVTDWYKCPEPLDVNCFYGGDLQGVEEELDYLQGLGVEAIYFNPLFLSPSNHKYDTQDYDYIDPHFAVIEDDCDHAMEGWEKNNGYAVRYIRRVTSRNNLEKSNAYFSSLVEKIHSRGMRVIMDGVFNHCGSFNKWMDREGIYLNKPGYEKGAYQSLKSPYRRYFKFYSRAANSRYDGWWGYATLPKLNYENSPRLREEIMEVGERWVSAPYGCDGWRLDVAADLGYSSQYNHGFWAEFRSRVRAANPEAVIFAEHYGDPSEWLKGNEWDSVMNYDAFMEPVTWFLTGMEKHSRGYDFSRLNDGKAFFESMLKNMSRLPRPALDCSLNQLSNHDHSRFLTRTNRRMGSLSDNGPESAGEGVDVRVMALGVIIQMTWPGAPGIYYGDEAGQVGWTDPDSRRTYPWGRENASLIEFHRNVIALRKSLRCLRDGSLKPLDAGNGYIAYGRFDGTDCAVVLINNGERAISLSVPVWEVGVTLSDEMTLELDTSAGPKETPKEKVRTRYGRITVELPPKSGKIFSKRFRPLGG